MEASGHSFIRSIANYTELTWTIKNFSRLVTKKYYSDIFIAGGYKWWVLIFPKGNNVDQLSLYLGIANPMDLPHLWSRFAVMGLSVVNQVLPQNTITKDTHHIFCTGENDWGFTSFMPLIDLYDKNKGFLVKDTLIIKAEIAFPNDCYVGLENQGATSYVNSLLQTLYHIPYFRKAVYSMPTTEDDVPSTNITLALQSLFYELQYNKYSVSTRDLTNSFGWHRYDSLIQHDVQEFNRVLCEKLEDRMKGTTVEGTIQELFEGHHMSCIECIHMDHKSTTKESFYDIQLDVKGCKDIYASFDKYVKVEKLEGDNKYHSQHGLQDATKGLLFINFPPVLQLQLKRFEYDSTRGAVFKINDRYEFPLELDLDIENGKYLSPDADRRVRNLFTLHSVLVHNGGEHGGRYHAFIRPTLSNQWFKFDDEVVTKEDMKTALEEQYGGEEEVFSVTPIFSFDTPPQMNAGVSDTPFKLTNYSNAYMLVYIRKSEMQKIICNVDEQDIVEHLRTRLKKAQEEKEKVHTIIKVARNEDIVAQIGKEIYCGLVDHDKVRCFRKLNQMSFSDFKVEVAKAYGVPVHFLRFWLLTEYQNGTHCIYRPVTAVEETQSVGQLRIVSNKSEIGELKLFLEVKRRLDLQPIQPPEKTGEDITISFKLYDPTKEELRDLGRISVKSSNKPSEILTGLRRLAGFSSNQEIELYEEIEFDLISGALCKPVDKTRTFQDSQLQDGDIVCFQKSLPIGSDQHYRYPDIPSFFKYKHNRRVVYFRSLKKPKDDEFSLELSKLFTYDEVVERLARHLGLHGPPSIRLTSHNHYCNEPEQTPIKYPCSDHLADMLGYYDQSRDILYYQVMETPLSSKEAQQGKPVSCVICLDAPMEGACIPCGHMAGCMSCLKEIKSKNWGCPICRAKIEQVVRIYAV